MRKVISDNRDALTPLSVSVLEFLQSAGFRFVQIRGVTVDFHYDYIEPHHLILIPLKELPLAQEMKDIYEPIDSELLREWALENTPVKMYVNGIKDWWQNGAAAL